MFGQKMGVSAISTPRALEIWRQWQIGLRGDPPAPLRNPVPPPDLKLGIRTEEKSKIVNLPIYLVT